MCPLLSNRHLLACFLLTLSTVILFVLFGTSQPYMINHTCTLRQMKLHNSSEIAVMCALHKKNKDLSIQSLMHPDIRGIYYCKKEESNLTITIPQVHHSYTITQLLTSMVTLSFFKTKCRHSQQKHAHS